VDYGSSYLPSDLNAAYLYAQLELADEINNDRLATWNAYYDSLAELQEKGWIELLTVPEGCVHNAHMFYLKGKDLEERTKMIAFLRSRDCGAVFHYVPLHTAPAGKKYGRFYGTDQYTTKESERLIRLPMYYGLTRTEQEHVSKAVQEFFHCEVV
jgi:dTDP-4-amino-4,6-dideoxygalactose transaminase